MPVVKTSVPWCTALSIIRKRGLCDKCWEEQCSVSGKQCMSFRLFFMGKDPDLDAFMDFSGGNYAEYGK